MLDDNRTKIRYLLGELSEEERSQLENRYFEDDTFFEELLGIEDELIDAYVRNQLTADERERFARHFLVTPERLERVRFARRLVTHIDTPATRTTVVHTPPTLAETAASAQEEEPAAGFWRALSRFLRVEHPLAGVSFAIAVLVMVLWGGWLLAGRKAPPDELAKSKEQPPTRTDEREERPAVAPGTAPTAGSAPSPTTEAPGQLSSTATPSAIAPLRRPTPGGRTATTAPEGSRPPKTVTFALVAGLTRNLNGGNQTNLLRIPAGADIVKLRLDVEQIYYPRHVVVLRSAEGKELSRIRRVRRVRTRAGETLFLQLPARILAGGDYVLELNGETASGALEIINEYYFSIR